MRDALFLTDEEIAQLTPDRQAEYLAILEEEHLATEHLTWREQARSEQLPPEAPWQTLFFRGGRGSGKSWAGAHIFLELIKEDPLRESDGPGQWAIVAPTFGDARDKCIESDESGLLLALGTNTAEVEAGQSSQVRKWNRSLGELELRDGTRIYIDGADDGAYRIQGYNLRGAWCDEVGLWKRWKTSWDESLGFALRKGQARRIATGTPKRDQPARALVMRLLADPAVVTRRLRTRDNAHNLSAAFLQEVSRYEGTELGRQELDGEVLEEAEGALWRRAWIEDARLSSPIAQLRRTVIALDPADGVEDGAEQAICVAQVDLNGELYVARSDGYRETPVAWLKRAVRLAAEMKAQLIVEKNHGGAYLTGLLESVMVELGIRAPYREISASQGKRTRAEPVAGLYEQGKVHHLSVFPELEDQLCTWDGTGASPDLLDSCVWAITELMGYGVMSGIEPTVHRYTDAPTPGVVRWPESSDSYGDYSQQLADWLR